MEQVLQEFREMRQGQEAHYQRMNTLNTHVGTIMGVLQEISTILSRAFPPPPPCVPGPSGLSTSVPATGRAYLPVVVPPAGTPAPAPADPTPSRRPGRPRELTGRDDGKDITTSKKAHQ